ncbi:hypothetical protein GGS20DRAFT_568822 [Poronia punctata]|nr:hypothetical protein GGS20DRAFT_568822 [Poronia punctata]
MATLHQEPPPALPAHTETRTDEKKAQIERATPNIGTGGKELIPQALPVLNSAFRTDAVFTWMMAGLPTEKQRIDTLAYFLQTIVKASLMNDGVFYYDAENWGSCAVLMPPGKKMDNPMTAVQAGLLGLLRRLGTKGVKHIREHGTAVKRAKKKAMGRSRPGRESEMSRYWYLFILGTHADRQGQGLGGALLEALKDKVRPTGRPLWLESSSEGSRRLYARHGFEEVEEITLGRGVVDADGLVKDGGEGIKTWGMIWRPVAKS